MRIGWVAAAILVASIARADSFSDGTTALRNKDYAAALAAFKTGAEAKDPRCMDRLGGLYMEGHGVEKDYAEGVKWIRRSAELGDRDGMSDYGVAFGSGRGVPQDYALAMKWYTDAGMKGNPTALNNIGGLYESGSGVVQDYVTAYAFYILARARGARGKNPANIKRLAGLMNKDQIAEAQKRAAASSMAPARLRQASAPSGSSVDQPAFHYLQSENDFAVVVGIEKYPDLPPAAYAESDARAVHRNLLALGYPPRNILLLIGANATKARLTAAVNSWLPRRVNDRSKVVFYYSGHGSPDTGTKSAYLVPVDGQPEDLPDTAMPLKELYAKLGELKAKQVLVALDSCFSGAGGRSVVPKGARPLVGKVDGPPVAANGRLVVMSASEGDQISGGLDAEKHGAFTYYFLKSLSADLGPDGATYRKPLKAIFSFVKPRVGDAARLQNRDQTPRLDPPDTDFSLR